MLFWDDEFCERLADQGFFVIRCDNQDVSRSTAYLPGETRCAIVDLADDTMANCFRHRQP